MKLIFCSEVFNFINFKIKWMFHSSWFTDINLIYSVKKNPHFNNDQRQRIQNKQTKVWSIKR